LQQATTVSGGADADFCDSGFGPGVQKNLKKVKKNLVTPATAQ
jgi:hypothetical protein